MNKNMGMGKCACGQWAVVKLQGVPKCLVCFGVGLQGIDHAIRTSLEEKGDSDAQ